MNIIIADDHPLFRRGLAAYINALNGYRVVGDVGNGRDLLDMLTPIKVDLIFLDLNIPGHHGFELLSIVRQQDPKVKVVILTMHDELAYARRAFELGANAYMVKDDAEEQLTMCLERVANGKTYCSLGEITDDSPTNMPQLTKAERHIFNLVASGNSSYQIAALLDLSVRTIDNHRANIARKLGLRGSNALLKFALRQQDMGKLAPPE